MDNQELAAIDNRTSEFVMDYARSLLLREMPDIEKFVAGFTSLLTDTTALRQWLGQLTSMRQAIRDLHVPMTSGNTAICTGCSLGGGQAPWPCATWNLTEAT